MNTKKNKHIKVATHMSDTAEQHGTMDTQHWFNKNEHNRIASCE
jgi:hypothetical protein